MSVHLSESQADQLHEALQGVSAATRLLDAHRITAPEEQLADLMRGLEVAVAEARDVLTGAHLSVG